MSVTRGTIARIRAQIAKARASQRPIFVIAEQRDGETAAEAKARVLAEHPQAHERDALFVIVDREEDEA